MNTCTNGDLAATAAARMALVRDLFPGGIPRLWCPPLTHFSAAGRLDAERIRRHLQTLACSTSHPEVCRNFAPISARCGSTTLAAARPPYGCGLLVPGSTGEGWEMSDTDVRELLGVVLDAARTLDLPVLIGVLRTRVEDVLASADVTVAWLQARTGAATPAAAFRAAQVVGFTVCPPKGADLPQAAIAAALERVLARGWPVALYQLPQVTGNEMAPETVQTLAARYPNFYLFKDTSGQDRVALAGLDLGEVFLVRGAEGDYARWPKTGGGPYDGFLLSTANVFAPQLAALLGLLEHGARAEAAALAQRLTAVVQQTFALVAGFGTGNPFTNANKVLDHILAYGSAALDHPPPLLYSGVRLPAEYVPAAQGFLRDNDLLPTQDYLAGDR